MATTTERLTKAVSAHQASRTDEAERLYRAILKTEPGHIDALNLLGILCAQTDRRDQALHHLGRAAAAAPEHVRVRYNFGNVLRDAGRLSEAEASYRSAIEIEPTHISAHHNLGATLLDLGRTEEARDVFTRVVTLNPDHPTARRELGRLAADAGDHAAAVEAWRAFLAAHPDDAAVWDDLGWSLRTLGRLDEAIEAMRTAIGLAPDFTAAHLNFARIAREAGDLALATSETETALRLEPDHPDANRAAAGLAVLARDYEVARRHLEVAARVEPASAEIAAELGDVTARDGDLDAAESAYRRAIELKPSLLRALVGLSRVALTRGDVEQAWALTEPLRTEHAHDELVIGVVTSVHLAAGRYEDVIAETARHIDRPGLSAVARRTLAFARGDAFDRLGRPDEAFASFEEGNRLRAVTFDRVKDQAEVDAIIRVFDRARLERPTHLDGKGPRPIFIVGMPRSGTTLIEQILQTHPLVTGAGERSLAQRGLGRLRGQQPMRPECPRLLETLEAPDLQILRDFMIGQLERAMAGEDSVTPVVVEKTPIHARFVGLLALVFPDARFVWSARDPMDTCLSCYFHDFTGNHPYAYDLDDLGFVAGQNARLLAHWQSVLADRLTIVQYETLVDDQETVTRALLEFCGLEWNDACLRFHESRRVVKTASAEQVRQKLYRTSIGRHAAYAKHLEPLREALSGP